MEGLSTRGDNSIVMKLATQEMGSDDAGRLLSFRNKFIKWFITDENISKLQSEAVTSTEVTETKGKTPSARLRAVLWRVHEQSGINLDFDTYYNTEMERIIEHYKGKLTP